MAASYLTTNGLATEAGCLAQKRTEFVTFINVGLIWGIGMARIGSTAAVDEREIGGLLSADCNRKPRAKKGPEDGHS